MRESAGRTTCALIAAALAIVTIAVYVPTSTHEFIRYDDNAYLWENGVVDKGLTLHGVVWAFTTTAVCNWHPLTWLSHMLDCELFDGLKRPGAHHMMSVAIHAINAVVLFFLLNFMTEKTWRSAMVAGLFALHPLHVESVAWVAERKDVLSTFFGFLSIWCYASFARRMYWKWYWFSLASFALSLLAKPMLVTLPCVFLLLDVWPLQRLRVSEKRDPKSRPQSPMLAGLVLEKLPFLILSIASSIITMYAQNIGGAVYRLDLLPMHRRVANALVAYAAYLGKMIWPTDLAVMYPLPKEVAAGSVLIAIFVLGVVSVVVFVFRRNRPWLPIGWLWYLGTLVPVIGLLQVGLQSMADRYTYIPLIGVFIMICWSVPELSRLTKTQMSAIAAVCVLILAAMATGTMLQLRHWREGESLFRHALAVTRDNYIAHNLLGFALAGKDRTDEAMVEYKEAIRLHYNFPAAHANLGSALMEKKNYEGAAEQFRIALKMQPASWLGHQNLAAALVKLGRFDDANGHFQEALRIRPDLLEAHLGLALALRSLRRMQEAIPEYEAALRMDDASLDAHVGLGLALASQDHYEEASRHFQRALEIQPGSFDGHYGLGMARAFQNRFDEAITEFQEALRLQPDNAEVQSYLNLARQKRDEAKGK